MSTKTDYDVIVVGGGGSGLATAVSSLEQGLKVLLIEKQRELGGTTGIAIGSFTANGTRFQQARGIEDTPDHHNDDAGQFPERDIEARNNAELRKFFLAHTAETLHWLADKGLVFHGPSPEPPNRVPRMHNVVPNAKAYIATLHAEMIRRGGHVECDCEVTQLVQEDNRVRGVVVRRQNQPPVQFTAKTGVVLASGDYAASSELIAKYKGKRFASVEGINPRSHGDGHRLVESVGGELINMDVTYGPEIRFLPPSSHGRGFAQLLPTSGFMSRVLGTLLPYVPNFITQGFIKRLLVTWQHPEDSLFKNGAILVNAQGERFADENEWPTREILLAQQPNKTGYILLDESLAKRFSQWPNFISTAPEIAYAYVNDYLRLRPDVAVQATTLPELAQKRNLPVQQLVDSVREVNTARETNPNDSTDGLHLKPLQGNRWVLLGPVKAYFTTTEGGAAINQQMQVLDALGSPISGLYAVGQVGLGGQILWGHGLHIAWAMTSGRLVGLHLGSQTT